MSSMFDGTHHGRLNRRLPLLRFLDELAAAELLSRPLLVTTFPE
jgi:hypothetical protein